MGTDQEQFMYATSKNEFNNINILLLLQLALIVTKGDPQKGFYCINSFTTSGDIML